MSTQTLYIITFSLYGFVIGFLGMACIQARKERKNIEAKYPDL